MLEKWTGDVIACMHIHQITYDELASKLGTTKGYISMILNGVRKPKGIEEKITNALDELISESGSQNCSIDELLEE